VLVFQDALTDFRMRTNASPHRLIFFRDGVSEGEFATVLREECRAIDEGIQAFMDTKPPNIKVPDPQVTFIVVGKR
jgi:eukaryotic translation initiation factor 2C